MEEQKFTVFLDNGDQAGWSYLASGNCGAFSLPDLVEAGVKAGYQPSAWAEESVNAYGGEMTMEQLYAESIAAGRVIKLIDGKYVPFGVTAPVVEEKTPEQAFDECLARARTVMADLLNAEMIARDGPAKPYIAPAIVQAPKSTAHPSIPSLSLSPDRAGADHRLGARL